MTVVTDKGNFRSFKDLLLDMRHEHYDRVRIKDMTAICNIIHLGGFPEVQTIEDIEAIVKELEKPLPSLQ